MVAWQHLLALVTPVNVLILTSGALAQVYSECPVYDELIPALLEVAAGKLPMKVGACQLIQQQGSNGCQRSAC